ncbi:hypothetical protein LCI24_11225 [Tenacibaculum sp. LAR 2:5]|uniref:Uncharacterized protein n=2 Tax=Tenacibaculum larymnensis TaxID=2878201 RepID=A0A9X4EVY6_9FLAO|nr:hypothetical protein [Tenacibaculum larymnensis]
MTVSVLLISCSQDLDNIEKEESFVIVNNEKALIKNAYWYKNDQGEVTMLFLNGLARLKENNLYIDNKVVEDRVVFLEFSVSITHISEGNYNFPEKLKHLYSDICISNGSETTYECNDYINLRGVDVDEDRAQGEVQITKKSENNFIININADDGNGRKMIGLYSGEINELVF